MLRETPKIFALSLNSMFVQTVTETEIKRLTYVLICERNTNILGL